MEARNYHVSLKRQRGEGFVAKCIELPGCLSEGKTKAEALRNIQDAIRLYLEDVEAERVPTFVVRVLSKFHSDL
jgi:predicted RNase H-like HicB family nuclease